MIWIILYTWYWHKPGIKSEVISLIYPYWFIHIDLSTPVIKLYDLCLQLMFQTTVTPILKPSYQTLTTVLITLIVLMPPLPPSPEPPWQQETTGRNVITQIYLMTVLSSVINLKWSTVARNLNHRLLVSLKFIKQCFWP